MKWRRSLDIFSNRLSAISYRPLRLLYIITKIKEAIMMKTKSDAGSLLKIGWAIEDITPVGPASLFGQYYERISTHVQSPLQVTACAMESICTDNTVDQAIMVSLDVLWILKSMQDAVRILVKEQEPRIDTSKIFMNATHTHSAPDPDPSTEYGKSILPTLCKVIIGAWNNRQPAGIAAGTGYAVTGHNRRVQYANGTTEMYGTTDRKDFIGLEGPTDAAVNMLFCWDENNELTGVIMNVPCPSQVTEAKYYVSADYWSEVRKQLQLRFSRKIFVLAQCGVAGDLSPRDLPRGYKYGEADMWDVGGLVEIGNRLAHVFDAAYNQAGESIQRKLIFRHTVAGIKIPTRIVSEEEYHKTRAILTEIHSREPKDENDANTVWNRFLQEIKENEKIKPFGPWDNKNTDYGIVRKMDLALEQYEKHKTFTHYDMELHVIRIGNVVIASNSFELFVDYGFSIIGRSKAENTFLVQLCCDYSDYLPTDRAISGGGYSAMATMVGPTGGKVLVEETLKHIERIME